MMLRIFRDKLIELVRGEEGVAFVVTLGVFFFMYLIIAGVYAVGTSVRERIHLQNACDAAAYSGAVVQADTLSRIATINRAMSWTYVQMTRRQMDYITYKWADHAAQHYQDDKRQADFWVSVNTHSACPNPMHKHDVNFSLITLNGAFNQSKEDDVSIRGKNAGLSSHISKQAHAFYANSLIQGQILEDYETLEKMGRALQTLAFDSLKAKMNTAIDTVLDAYLHNLQTADYEVYNSLRDRHDPHDPRKYFRELRNEWDDENLFLSFSLRRPGDANSGKHNYVFDAFKQSGDDSSSHAWFRRTGGGSGLRRRYAGNWERLMAEWTWHATAWKCTVTPAGKSICIPTTYATCAHPSHEKCRCSVMLWTPSVVTMHTKSVANNDSLYPKFAQYYDTPARATARPIVLEPSYFGKDGTITVGIACTNVNPWCSIMRQVATKKGVLQGLFGAFNHFCDKTLVFASAKAGYRTYDETIDRDGNPKRGRNYRIDGRDENDWNLYTSDWDAVLIPVRMAKSGVKIDGSWGDAQNFLEEWVRQLKVNDKRDNMLAGGEHEPSRAFIDELDNDRAASQTAKKWRWYNSDMRYDYAGNADKRVEAKWQVGNPGGKLDWNKLTDRMFH